MTRFLLLALIFIVCASCSKHPNNSRLSIDLSGNWQFDIDPADSGIKQKWFLKELSDSIRLPGTMDLNQKGYKNTDTTTNYLNRLYRYTGPAWYKKKISIPSAWQDRTIHLVLERSKPSKIWIDDHYIGESLLLASLQEYDLSQFLSPGEHTITVRVDNNPRLTPYGSHMISDHTQTNWNGIIGKLCLEASSKTYISDLQVYPDINKRKIKVLLSLENQLKIDNIDVELQITMELNNEKTNLKSAYFTVLCDSIIELEYDLGDKTDLWDENHQPVYHLNAIINNKHFRDNREVSFGMRKFETKGTNFIINNKVTFLRGKHDACVFPLTGCTPMDTGSWLRVFKIAKLYGINHYRFHTWCPPEAAFEAADKLGIYLQPELQFFKEGVAILKCYANHPSFVMFSAGNEISGDQKKAEALISRLKKIDPRPLYTQGSNNNIGYTGPTESADYHTAARTPYPYDTLLIKGNIQNSAIGTPYAYDTILTHSRLTHAFIDSENGGILNRLPPSTNVNYDYAVSQIHIPLVGHEVGQYQIYPDYKEINKYTGILKARNLEVFRERLNKAGMLDQNADFTKASGAWAALCYRAEIEAALRTKGFGGFQLLDLQDYPGQGTALVGILDAFMDSKNVISREEWVQFCNDVVPLLLFNKFCWTTNESFSASLKVANYSGNVIDKDLVWKVSDSKGNIVNKGRLINIRIPDTGLNKFGAIEFPLNSVKVPDKLTIEIAIEGTKYKNTYPIWVYPKPGILPSDDNILITSTFDNNMVNSLERGRKVLYFPGANHVKNNSVGGLFPPDFWNYNMFKRISEQFNKPVSPGTLGILTNPEHPIFNSFPTDFHTNWQWWSIIKSSNPLILDHTPADYRPIVQVIDNLERNHKLGLIFEFAIGKGKLLVCMSNLPEIKDKPEANQLFRSILSYMSTDKFTPKQQLSKEDLQEMFSGKVSAKKREGVKNASLH